MVQPLIQNQSSESPPADSLTLLCDDKSSFNNHCSTDKGFYYFTESGEITDDFYGFRLMYVDYATQKEVYLCSDSGCRHNSESCTAVFNADEFGFDSLVFVHEGYLYVLNRDYDQDGTTYFSDDGSNIEPEKKSAELYRMGLDGSSRQKVFTFPSNTTVEKMVFADGANLRFITKELTFQKDSNGAAYTSSANRNLVTLNLTNGKLENPISLDISGGARCQVVGGSGSKLVLDVMEYPDGITEEEARKLSDDDWIDLFEKSHTACYTLDINTKEMKEIFRTSHAQKRTAGLAVKDGFLYVSDYDTNTIRKINLDGGEKTVLASKAYYLSAVLSDSLCCFGDGDDHSLYFIDRKSGEISQCTLTNKSLGWTLDVLADAGDKLLVIYDYEATPTGEATYDIRKNKFALISKADLYDSKDSFEPIDMAGSGM